MMRIFITVFSITFCVCVNAWPAEVAGKVVSVIDGNTIEFLTSDNETFRFVFAGIDCPELNQEFGDEAKKHLEKILKGKVVTLVVQSRDRLGNHVGTVKLSKDEDPRIELLKKGLAWTQEKNPDPELENLMEGARSKRLGLWKQTDPTAPWLYRRQQSMLSPKMG